MDIRVEKTRQSIINAFIELRSHRELERITIKELCERARINKSTFYSHYQDIYHLSDTLETEVVVSIMENLSHPEKVLEDTADFSRVLQRRYAVCIPYPRESGSGEGGKPSHSASQSGCYGAENGTGDYSKGDSDDPGGN